MSFIPAKKRGRTSQEWIDAAENGLNRFIKSEMNLMTNELFDGEAKYSNVDCEACFLSQFIFRNLFGLYIEKAEFCNNRYILVGNDRFYFDIMNNPKYAENKRNRIGAVVSKFTGCKEEYEEWERTYHTLGNFAPIPQFIEMDGKKRNVQFFHEASCYERWDLLLKYLQGNWGDKAVVSFSDYLIITGQIIYDNEVFNSIPEDEIITYEWYKQQSEYIKTRNINIICFIEGNSVSTDEDAKRVVSKMNKLIRIRTAILKMLLKEKS